MLTELEELDFFQQRGSCMIVSDSEAAKSFSRIVRPPQLSSTRLCRQQLIVSVIGWSLKSSHVPPEPRAAAYRF